MIIYMYPSCDFVSLHLATYTEYFYDRPIECSSKKNFEFSIYSLCYFTYGYFPVSELHNL